MSSLNRRGFASTLCAGLALGPAGAAKAANPNVVRRHSGRFEFRNRKDGRRTGGEDWTMLVHPDGSRTLTALMQNDVTAAQMSAVYRIGADFRPVELYATFWRNGAFARSIQCRVEGDRLHSVVTASAGRKEETTEAPQHFSMAPHPLSMNAFHTWYYDLARGGEQSIAIFDINGYTPGLAAPAGTLKLHKLAYLGAESVKTPAGRFRARHFTTDQSHFYLSGPDSLSVRFDWPAGGNDYLLTAYRADPA